jgi:hypothetical protein
MREEKRHKESEIVEKERKKERKKEERMRYRELKSYQFL